MSEATHITSEFGSQPQDVEAFVAAYDAVAEYNDQFSMGKMMARTIIGGLKQAQKAEELEGEGLSPEEAESAAAFLGEDSSSLHDEQQMLREVVGITNAGSLDGAGLEISPLHKDYMIASKEGAVDVGKVRLLVSDAAKFSGFLLQVPPQVMPEQLQDAAVGVSRNTLLEIEQAISEERDTDKVAETLAYADGIVVGLTHIGAGDSSVTKDIETLAGYAKQGIAREYVAAKRLQLFTAPEDQAFGPAQWQGDMSGEGMRQRWGEVVSAIRDALSNPNAAQLASEMLQSARVSLDYAKKDWAELDKSLYSSGYGKDFDAIFETITLELDLINSPDEEK